MVTSTAEKVTVWTKAREAVALGMSQREVAERYGLSYEAIRKRAQREEWPTPSRLLASHEVPTPAAIVAASWQERGEAHRRRIMDIVDNALSRANVAPPENWADLERAARIGDRAAGLEKAAPAITLAFPIATSGEGSPFYEAETIFAATSPHLTPPPLEP
jgi:transcriptional regulator with XRE-family HTH domain